MARSGRRWWLWGTLGLAALGGLGVLVWVIGPAGGAGGLGEALRGRGRVVRLGEAGLGAVSAEGAEIVEASKLPAVSKALEGTDPAALARALDEAKSETLLVDGELGGDAGDDAPLRARLAAYDYVPGLRGVRLAPAGAIYERHRIPDAEPPLDEAMARVARGILEGKKPPRISSFPKPLRRIRSVEMMVVLLQGSRERLWRSARGSSIARALITAAVVARERWQERETAMGAPLEEALPDLDLEVAMIVDDGTVAGRAPAFLDRAIKKAHGVGYERKGTWRYLLPEKTQHAESGSQAFETLFVENGLETEAMGRPDVRLYRLVVRVLARSAASDPSDAGSPLPGSPSGAADAGSSDAGASGSGAGGGSGGSGG